MSDAIEKYWASAARKAAFDILLELDEGRAHSDDLMRVRKIRRLSEPDRNLTTALVLGVVRWQRALDERVLPLLKKPNAKLDIEVRLALRLGAFQILFMDRIPARAAIDESVELCKLAGHKFASGLVNAVLRKLAATERPEWDATQAYPAWILERWQKTYGVETAAAVCRAGMEQPTHAVRLADAAAEAELREAGVELAPAALLTGARVIAAGDLTETEIFRTGRARIQDEASQLVGEIAAFRDNPNQKMKNILDTCAAPGGKTLILAERNPQARIVACERNEARCGAMQKRMTAMGASVQCRQIDATLLDGKEKFDVALVDAPCSGTGTLGRNPEIRHRLALEDLARQAGRQQAILAAALQAVRAGGRLIYSTCSIEAEENEQVIEEALKATPEARSISLAGQLEAMARAGILTADGAEQLQRRVTDAGALRILPGELSTDGFFIAALEIAG